ncbi:MAG: NupC/NupG family nucleoside CNT transporter [Planctomycetaceae bacterium]|nr:NupC/NupG family nucleoside CNT transporter [Planctomycetaceae bacterium]
MERVVSFGGLFVMMGLAWAMSTNRKTINFRIVAGGLVLQFGMALLVLKTDPGLALFQWLGDLFKNMQTFTDEGSKLVFGVNPMPDDIGFPPHETLLRTITFGILPTIIFFSSVMSVLYYLGIVQVVVRAIAKVMQRTLGTSGAETLSAASNIFVGQTEAPLVIKPYLPKMTESELMALMVGGFATIAGGVLAVYVGMGIHAGHLMTASVISAPAALLIAKIMVPEVEVPETAGGVIPEIKRTGTNVVEAATLGATDGLKLALNVAAMLIAFTALVAALDALIVWVGELLRQEWSLGMFLGYIFSPLAWAMGIPRTDIVHAGELLGLKMVANEFVAYSQLTEWQKPESAVQLTERTQIILTYALAGFANFASVGIQIGGIGSLVPERQKDLARIAVKAMLGGTLACFMTACIAGILL